MPKPIIYAWINAPFLRLLLALVPGILIQDKFNLPVTVWLTGFLICFLLVVVYGLTPIKEKYKWNAVNGFFLLCLIAFFGGLLTWMANPLNNEKGIGQKVRTDDFIAVTLQEPLVEKANSNKALTMVDGIYRGRNYNQSEGKLIVYFKKDSAAPKLVYGSQILIHKALQEIKNSGNPAGFDYRSYCLHQGITHQVFLSAKDYVVLPTTSTNFFTGFLFRCRDWILKVLRSNISGDKEQGLAEALLIGYKDDLDKNLVQAYSNTGVVHIIAISGLHLGLIYGLLVWVTKPLRKKFRFSRLVLILVALWTFSLLAGGQPSVLRSAVTFSFIAWGEVIARRTNVFNTLALSAFCLLCVNPYWLWDVGFQLSYAALCGILLFFKPVYNWFYFPNKTLDFIWKLNAVTIVAQIFTLPISLYHFHQLPTLFLLTNVVAVPLSGIILYGEIALCLFFFIRPLAKLLGWCLHHAIWAMNAYIERLDSVVFSTWNGLYIKLPQTLLLLTFSASFCFWLLNREKKLLLVSLCAILSFFSILSFSMIQTMQQKKIIVYNIPGHSGVDLVAGQHYSFMGDTALLPDDFLRNFHMQPTRIEGRTAFEAYLPINECVFGGKQIVWLNKKLPVASDSITKHVDLLILSGNPKIYMKTLVKQLNPAQVVIDGSVPLWKSKYWKKDCDSLHIPCHCVQEKGAFVMNL